MLLILGWGAAGPDRSCQQRGAGEGRGSAWCPSHTHPAPPRDMSDPVRADGDWHCATTGPRCSDSLSCLLLLGQGGIKRAFWHYLEPGIDYFFFTYTIYINCAQGKLQSNNLWSVFTCLILDILLAALNHPQRFLYLSIFTTYRSWAPKLRFSESYHNQRQPKIDSVNCSPPAVTLSCSIWEEREIILVLGRGQSYRICVRMQARQAQALVQGLILVLYLLMGHPALCLHFFLTDNGPRDHLSLNKIQHMSCT